MLHRAGKLKLKALKAFDKRLMSHILEETLRRSHLKKVVLKVFTAWED